MKTPCIAACKNNGGICSGCYRTVDEIVRWSALSDSQRANVMDALDRRTSTHSCPSCGQSAQCDIQEGKSTCWCYSLDVREATSSQKACLCRQCLTQQPIA
ncbi:cysteine-rich CWC family protein [Vibrio ostreicida]|uniref:Cysteine-rich CWC family protein n=1 Tax=Vibrio ostreicida TaxID=526588 RepID=A0ABT8BWD6_9VIBR|nr:cysteine-rich CWC family protein [Vibrio ostreicida]MDN3611492.1 cysteine-rich CWC family protein [Vibrio ostreicida]NPD08989.1 DUF1289 domain-containing protein [Vibrio ostreicida]